MSEDQRDRFEQELRRWAEQPPPTPPATAARQVLSRLDRARAARRPVWWPVWRPAVILATALMLALGLGWWARHTTVPAEPAAETVSATLETATLPPLDDGVVLIWLDPETPLYLSLQSHETNPGDTT